MIVVARIVEQNVAERDFKLCTRALKTCPVRINSHHKITTMSICLYIVSSCSEDGEMTGHVFTNISCGEAPVFVC